MANAVLRYQRHSFFFNQMIVQIHSLHPCLFERNLKAVINFSLVIKPIHDFFFLTLCEHGVF